MTLADHIRDALCAPVVIGGTLIGDEVAGRVLQRVHARAELDDTQLDDMLCETIYREQRRLAHADAEPRTHSDREFVKWLRHAFAHSGTAQRRALVQAVIERYVGEISGHFDRRIYAFATSVVPPALSALLHGAKPSAHVFDVDERVLLEGDVPGLRRAVQTGTVVLVPTHVSNLDSLVMGHAIQRLGLPPFAYGAGLNLFSHAATGFFMRHLGAFTVDRKKTDPLYLETVKEYVTVLLERDQHLLFFPGGTRSRSGAIESHLKLGFLSRVVTAFANRRIRDPHSRPLFVVPCTLSYPLVLESASLIEEYLGKEGGPHFVDVRDEFDRPARWLGFLSGLAELDVQVHVRFGSPLDPIGHDAHLDAIVGEDAIDPARYLLVDGVVTRDDARDAEYTKSLTSSILDAYRRNAVALPSSVLAFALFNCLQRRYPRLDLFRLLRVLGPSAVVTLAELEPQIDSVLEALRSAADSGEIVLDPELQARGKAAVIEQGVATLTGYHRPPVLVRRDAVIEITQPTLLLYYKNRLEGFGLPGASLPAPKPQNGGFRLP